MAGTKGKSGGVRKGAGRKRKEKQPENIIPSTFNDIESVYADMPKLDIGTLDFPQELDGMPYAKETWNAVIELDKNSSIHLLNARHAEALKSYVMAVCMRRLLIEEWKRQQYGVISVGDTIKVNPLIREFDKKNEAVNRYAEDLGLTVLGEYKLAKMNKTSPKLTGDSDDSGDDLFD